MQTDSHFTLKRPAKRPAQEIEDHRLGHRSPGRVAKIVWPLRLILEPRFLHGKRHPSLGPNLIGRPFGRSGLSGLRVLKEYGLRPDDVCVDYGCGTLRVGIHLINYLKPGNYWGFDAEKLLREGTKLIGEHLIAEKAPHLRVISPEAIAEVAREKPRLLYSRGVLISCPPGRSRRVFQQHAEYHRCGGPGDHHRQVEQW